VEVLAQDPEVTQVPDQGRRGPVGGGPSELRTLDPIHSRKTICPGSFWVGGGELFKLESPLKNFEGESWTGSLKLG